MGMNDKLVKVDTAIAPASDFASKIEEAIAGDCERTLDFFRNVRASTTTGEPCAKCGRAVQDHADVSCVRLPSTIETMRCARCGRLRKDHKTETAIAQPALTNCPACGSANMNDPQAQFVGACSSSCAKQLGISEEVLRASGSMPPALLPTAIAPRVETDYSEMAQIIVHEWLERFGLPDPDDINVLDSTVLQAAIKRARFIAVNPKAEIYVSECGCIWALQTVHRFGAGDVILRNCDKHAGLA